MWHVLVSVFALAAAVATVVAVVGWQRRHRAFAVGAVAVWAGTIALWALAALGMLLSRTELQVYVATTGIFVAIGAAMASLYCVCMASVDRAWRPSRRLILLLSIEPALVVAALATNPLHRQYIRSWDVGLQDTLVPDFGPLFWAHVVYSYALFVVGLARPVRAFVTARPGQRWVFGWVPAAVVPPTIANIVGLNLVGRTVDPTVVGYVVTVVVAWFTLVRRALPELVPVARRRVFDTISDAVAVADLEGRLLDVNPAATDLFRRLYPDLPQVLGTAPLRLPGTLAFPESGETDYDLVDVNGSGVDLHVRVSAVLDTAECATGWVLVARDVTDLNRQRRQLEEANARLRTLQANLAEQAVRDELTGLHNRRYLLEALDREIHRAVRAGVPLSLAVVDIDHFKEINDRHGHVVGDEVLVQLGRLLRDEVRQSDVVARYGGEEFVLVLPGLGTHQAGRRIEALRQRVGTTVLSVDGRTVRVTLSAGVASLDGAGEAARLIAIADRALYEAKRRGRNRVELSV